MTQIRSESSEDAAAIRHVLEQAFGGSDEANLVEMLREANKTPISLVATQDGQLVGHILFSPVTITPAKASVNSVGLAPVAVLPEFQNRGIGSHLIREGLQECWKAAYDVVVVLGDHRFYSRFGFSRASAYGLGNEYGADEHFMVLALREGALAKVSGIVKYQPEFSV